MCLQAKECQGSPVTLETGRGMGGRRVALPTPSFCTCDLQACGFISIVLSHAVCGYLFQQLWELIGALFSCVTL